MAEMNSMYDREGNEDDWFAVKIYIMMPLLIIFLVLLATNLELSGDTDVATAVSQPEKELITNSEPSIERPDAVSIDARK